MPALAPVVIPIAANGIKATGGLLAGAAAAGKLGGIPAAARGLAALGALLPIAGAFAPLLPIPIVFPEPEPNPVPGLDPGLNGPEPEPNPAIPPAGLAPTVIPGREGDPVGTEYEWTLSGFLVQYTPARYRCNNNEQFDTATDQSTWFSFTGRGTELRIWSYPKVRWQVCGPANDDSQVDDGSIGGAQLFRNGKWEWLISEGLYRGGILVNKFLHYKEPGQYRYEQWTINRDEIPVVLPDGLNGTPETIPAKPRPLPLPIKPLPAPEPEPAPIPLPEPEPEPDPLVVPTPNTPDAPPITIPNTPPAVPQVPPKPSPFPNPTEPGVVPAPSPDPLPVPEPGIEPGKIPLPTPIPGIPAIPEPSPNPNPLPAPGPQPQPEPGPVPIPGPQPVPEPGTDPLPEPGITPLPTPIPVPIPTQPGLAPQPSPITGTQPDGDLAPRPTPSVPVTPPQNHFPVSGGPAITPGGVRQDLAAIAAEVGRIEQKTAQQLDNQKDIPWWLLGPLLEALGNLLEQDIPGTTYELTGVCEEVDGNGNQPTAQFPVAPAKNLGAIINRLDTIDQMLQQHLEYKTPTCGKRPQLQGDFRTINFIADEPSGTHGDRPRKRFRYRSTSGASLGQVVDHWADFVWQAGPVCVQHADASWGTPQVWAASADEGKRVIRHAAREAGIDANQDGRWIVGGSTSPRVGLPGTMRVNTMGGYYWITARDGSAGRPIVART